MTKREMEQLIDDRVIELKNEVDKKYEADEDRIRKEHEVLVEELKKTILDKAKELDIAIDKYNLKYIAESYSATKKYKEIGDKINKEKNKINEEAKELKKKLVIMGLKNREVASILMKYLGMEEK